jgi:uncharacterized protein (TIGR00730 family)
MNVCVFCGSSTGINPQFSEAAKELATLLSEKKCSLVFGGGKVGLMGVVADEMLKRGSTVIGVIPDFLVKREVAHSRLSELIVVKSMHERKRRMADMADVFISLPGGMGTLDEMAEILTWKQLKLINKPLGLLNTLRYFDDLLRQMKRMTEEGFMHQENLDAIKVSAYPLDLLTSLGVVTA